MPGDRWSASLLVPLLVLSACSHFDQRGIQPDVRRVPYGAGELEVDGRISEPLAIELASQLSVQDMQMSAIWTIPGEPELKLAIITRSPAADRYGPQLAAIRTKAGRVEVVHESGRLFDDDFIHPAFFAFPDRTLLLADHGSEDAYGVLVWSFERGAVRDLGELPIALPEDGGVFTRGAAPTARVQRKNGAYLIRIPGPVLLHPREEREQTLATRGEVATFREDGGKFELLAGRTASGLTRYR